MATATYRPVRCVVIMRCMVLLRRLSGMEFSLIPWRCPALTPLPEREPRRIGAECESEGPRSTPAFNLLCILGGNAKRPLCRRAIHPQTVGNRIISIYGKLAPLLRNGQVSTRSLRCILSPHIILAPQRGAVVSGDQNRRMSQG